MENDVIDDILNAEGILRHNYRTSNKFTKYSLMYPFSTENLSSYYEEFNFKNKKVLTVAGSGDHAFNAILCGAKEVSTFDVNRFTKYYVDLKKAAISALNYEDFLVFFDKNHLRYSFNLDKYKQLRDCLGKNSVFFWDMLFKRFVGPKIGQDLFRTEYNPMDIVVKCNPYMNEQQYYELQSKIEKYKIKFIESNIVDLESKIVRKIMI